MSHYDDHSAPRRVNLFGPTHFHVLLGTALPVMTTPW